MKHTTEIHGEIIPIGAKDQDTFEYWVYKASNGENSAACWQECYRIARDLLSQQQEEWITKLENILDDGRPLGDLIKEELKRLK